MNQLPKITFGLKDFILCYRVLNKRFKLKSIKISDDFNKIENEYKFLKWSMACYDRANKIIYINTKNSQYKDDTDFIYAILHEMVHAKLDNLFRDNLIKHNFIFYLAYMWFLYYNPWKFFKFGVKEAVQNFLCHNKLKIKLKR